MSLKAEHYPQLRAFLRGYLHEDFPFEHGSALDARAAYLADASFEERHEFADDCRRFLRAIDGLPVTTVRQVLRRTFRSAWAPRTLVEAAAVLAPPVEPPLE
jgi:hypothetical protein